MTSHTTSDNNDSQRSLGQCLLIFVQNAQKSMITCNAIGNGNYIPPLVTRTSDACVFASLNLFSSFSARPGVQNICFLKVRSLIKPQVMNVQNEKKAVHTSKIHLVTMHYRGWYNACFIFSDETVGLNRQTCCEPVDGKSTNIILHI